MNFDTSEIGLLGEEEFGKARELIGDDVLLMTVPNREYDRIEELEQAMTESRVENLK